MKLKFSKKEHTDSGLALLLIVLIPGIWLKSLLFYELAIAVVLVLLIIPVIIYPFTFLWFNISDLLGKVMSKIILTLIFFLFVLPVALMRKVLGKDTLRLKKFKKTATSVFSERNHEFIKTDFTAPY